MKRLAPLILAGLLWATPALGSNAVTVEQVVSAITRLQPALDSVRQLGYALAITEAATKYGIDPFLLVAIAHQESSFRESLPEGSAGERGICQLLKGWAENPLFQQEFGTVMETDFDVPANSFMYAAWLLSTLRKERKGKGDLLPFWTFYNARNRDRRLEYYAAVSRHF